MNQVEVEVLETSLFPPALSDNVVVICSNIGLHSYSVTANVQNRSSEHAVMATSSTGLFYVYAKNINDDWSYRYLITFATRDVADTWWRLVTDSVVGGYARFKSVQRVTSQFYTHNPGEGNIPDTITDPKVAQSLRGKIFFTLLNDRDGRILSVIPVQNWVDRSSGDRFYIRSSSDPSLYWYYNGSRVVASRDRRTRFTVTIADRKRAPGTIMIGDDEVFISVGSSTNIGVANQQDQLSASDNPFPFKLSALNNDFQIDYYLEGKMTEGFVTRNPGKGEGWELV
ncbi:hypothetical protein LshimejAT787_2300250 [Lyophyllum shimeji]|uniref:Uncharacterized protein n=1 Tax=Lyophyllum shimeji TaxID=47721 RepID=A0A9P3PYP5_LYOSH|nr:hypothetical protein LshimejAT787_2300250 [Lyophyllum shimeji]